MGASPLGAWGMAVGSRETHQPGSGNLLPSTVWAALVCCPPFSGFLSTSVFLFHRQRAAEVHGKALWHREVGSQLAAPSGCSAATGAATAAERSLESRECLTVLVLRRACGEGPANEVLTLRCAGRTSEPRARGQPEEDSVGKYNPSLWGEAEGGRARCCRHPHYAD